MDQIRHGELLTGGWLEERMVRCGRKGCRCARGHPHWPYVYLTDRIWDERAERWRVRRRYVRTADVPEVRRVMCATKAVNRDIMRLLRDQPRILAELDLQRQFRARQLLPRLQAAMRRSAVLLRLLSAAAGAAGNTRDSGKEAAGKAGDHPTEATENTRLQSAPRSVG